MGMHAGTHFASERLPQTREQQHATDHRLLGPIKGVTPRMRLRVTTTAWSRYSRQCVHVRHWIPDCWSRSLVQVAAYFLQVCRYVHFTSIRQLLGHVEKMAHQYSHSTANRWCTAPASLTRELESNACPPTWIYLQQYTSGTQLHLLAQCAATNAANTKEGSMAASVWSFMCNTSSMPTRAYVPILGQGKHWQHLTQSCA